MGDARTIAPAGAPKYPLEYVAAGRDYVDANLPGELQVPGVRGRGHRPEVRCEVMARIATHCVKIPGHLTARLAPRLLTLRTCCALDFASVRMRRVGETATGQLYGQ